jgi:hypothetical protein
VLILLNILALIGLFASNNIGQDLLNTVLGSFSRIPKDFHQGSGVTSGDHYTTVQLVQEGGHHPPPEMGCSHAHVKQTAKLRRDGSASPSTERAVAIR